jgi:hypothetical protein
VFDRLVPLRVPHVMTTPSREALETHLVDFGVPEHLHRGLLGYLLERQPVGGFLLAVLENNLALAIARNGGEVADLVAIVRFLVNNAAWDQWGSTENVAAWLVGPKQGRHVGRW